MSVQSEPQRRVLWKSLQYAMTEDESSQWDAADSCDRRQILYALGERLAEETNEDDDCCFMFHHSSGEFLGKTVYHQPVFRQIAPLKMAK